MPDKPNEPTHPVELETIFTRVKQAYDLSRMQQTRILGVGAGGAAGYYEDMARCGVGEFVLIDPDDVAEPNIGTQQAYLDEVGRPKVEVIAERLRRINPAVRILRYHCRLEEISDLEFEALAFLPFVPKSTADPGTPEPQISLLCSMTDDFCAQSRCNRLALKFGLPALLCQLYQFGLAGELTFTYPGVTPACHRCMLSPRYKAYLFDGYQNTVTSEGAPIFATTRVNALCGMVTLAILHHGTQHPRFGDLLARIGNRTLVQIRMHPDAPYQAFAKVFSGADTDRLFFDEAVWLPQEADPHCPDCLGGGDLALVKGRLADTRISLKNADHAAFEASS